MACVQLLPIALVIWLHCGMTSLAYKRRRDRKGLCKVQVSKSTEMSFRLLGWQGREGSSGISGAGSTLPAWPVWPEAHSQRNFPQVPAWWFQFGSVQREGILSRHIVSLTRQISEVLWDSAQVSELPWDWITTGFSNLSLNPDSMINLCPWTNYIPSLSLSFLIFKGNKIIIHLYRLWGFQEIRFESTCPSSGHDK